MKEKKLKKLRKKTMAALLNDPKFIDQMRIIFGMLDYKKKEVRKEIKKMIKYYKKKFDWNDGESIIERRKKERSAAREGSSN